VLITLRGTNTLLEHFAGLLDCARAARDGTDFEGRLTTPGLLSSKAIQYCDEIRTVIGDAEGRSVSRAEVWTFLRLLHVLSLDLNSATGQTEAAIKSLLAHTAVDPDPVGAAEITWNALLREVGDGMPQARSLQREDLPAALRQRHSAIGTADQRAPGAIAEHSGLILAGVRSTIGPNGLHLGRTRLVQQIMERLDSAQVVLVTGSAGSGKSGAAKDALNLLAVDHFAFAFRAEEFARPHFDETLLRSQVPANAAILGAILAAQGRKVLLVESVERLLEASTRDAFSDLLALTARDQSWQLVLTCRDYSADLVWSSFLEAARVGHAVVAVPDLDDDELRELEGEYPAISLPLGNASLRRLLRNPYVLDKALLVPWADGRPLPTNEYEFRARFWQDIVRADHVAGDGMPRRREDAFMQVAVRRARALALYATARDLDPTVIAALVRDSLLVTSRQTTILVAPAHDVLEDWAILKWIDEQYLVTPGSASGLATVLGTYPAIRRTYRKWVSELAERDPAEADRLFQAILRDEGVPSHFRDDTLVSLLRSPAAATFLERHKDAHFSNNKRLLRRVIHLLRLACVTTPTWAESTHAHASLFHVPDGPAWATVLGLVGSQLGSFSDHDEHLLLGLVANWARGVSWHDPYPAGAASAAAIAHWLIPQFDDYRSEKPRKRTLEVIAKIPNADRAGFLALLHGSEDRDGRDRPTEDFRTIIFASLGGIPAARDLPAAVIEVARNFLFCSDDDVTHEWSFAYDIHFELRFGIKYGRTLDYFPASGYRGPFLSLLRFHPGEGLKVVIEVLNHSADWYANPRVPTEDEDRPGVFALAFPDGTSRNLWGDTRLWNLYRGTSNDPYALQSLLMSFEARLLERAQQRPNELDELRLWVLKQSDSAAITAVVASVATAYPRVSGETLLVLLRSPECILLDRDRLAHESQAPSKNSGCCPGSMRRTQSTKRSARRQISSRTAARTWKLRSPTSSSLASRRG
jgi:hypothetical protein